MGTNFANLLPIQTWPAFDSTLITTVLIAGAFATIGFDVLGQTISPLLKSVAAPYLGAKLAPVALATQALSVVFDVPAKLIRGLGIGHGLHILTGLLFYPLGYVLLARPLSTAFPPVPWWASGIIFGVALFIFALYGMAHLIAGNPPFLGWGGITWVALWGHIVYGLIVAAVCHLRGHPRSSI